MVVCIFFGGMFLILDPQPDSSGPRRNL